MDGLPVGEGNVQYRVYKFEYAQARREYKFHIRHLKDVESLLKRAFANFRDLRI
jgi:DNA recombination-dependent growth factor C